MNIDFNLEDLKKVFVKLGIKRGDKIQVNSNILNILKSKKPILSLIR